MPTQQNLKQGTMIAGKRHAHDGTDIKIGDKVTANAEVGEIIINRQDSAENCELLSEINSNNGIAFDCDKIRSTIEQTKLPHEMEKGGALTEKIFSLTFYNVLINSADNTQEVYLGIDEKDATNQYNRISAGDEDSYMRGDLLKVLQKSTNDYKFIYTLDEEYEESIEDFPVDEYYNDETYYELQNEGDWESVESEDFKSSKQVKEDEEKQLLDTVETKIKDYIKSIAKEYKNAAFLGSTFYALVPYLDGFITVRVADHFFNPSNIILGRQVIWENMDEINPKFTERRNVYGFLSIHILDSNTDYYKDRRGYRQDHKYTQEQSKYPDLIRVLTYDITNESEITNTDFIGEIDYELDAIKEEIDIATKNGEFKADDEVIEYKKGGPLNVAAWEQPDAAIYNYALQIKNTYPAIWDKGGNIYGNEAFRRLATIVKRGYWLKSEEWFYNKWQSFKARHQHDFRLPGVIANLKWLAYPNNGEAYVKQLITEAAENKKADGGSIYKNEIDMEQDNNTIQQSLFDTDIKANGGPMMDRPKYAWAMKFKGDNQKRFKSSPLMNYDKALEYFHEHKDEIAYAILYDQENKKMVVIYDGELKELANGGPLNTDSNIQELLQFARGGELIPGGEASGLTIDGLAKKHNLSVSIIKRQLQKGAAHETEHTANEAMATEIAMDHLAEDPFYYDKLELTETTQPMHTEKELQTGTLITDTYSGHRFTISQLNACDLVITEITHLKKQPYKETLTYDELFQKWSDGKVDIEGYSQESPIDYLYLKTKISLLKKEHECNDYIHQCGQYRGQINEMLAEKEAKRKSKLLAKQEREAAEALKEKNKNTRKRKLAMMGMDLGDDYEKGGAIPNNYEGKTPREIFDSWTTRQKEHFFTDHEDFLKDESFSDVRKAKYAELTDNVKNRFNIHISEGQYAKGGSIKQDEYDAAYEKKYNELLDKDLSTTEFLKQHDKWIKENAPKYGFKPGEYAKGGPIPTPAQKKIVGIVMKEFKQGKLKSSSGTKVTDAKQAIAIALSEAGLSKDTSDKQLKQMGLGGFLAGVAVGAIGATIANKAIKGKINTTKEKLSGSLKVAKQKASEIKKVLKSSGKSVPTVTKEKEKKLKIKIVGMPHLRVKNLSDTGGDWQVKTSTGWDKISNKQANEFLNTYEFKNISADDDGYVHYSKANKMQELKAA